MTQSKLGDLSLKRRKSILPKISDTAKGRFENLGEK